jgi:hypothetical protein
MQACVQNIMFLSLNPESMISYTSVVTTLSCEIKVGNPASERIESQL